MDLTTAQIEQLRASVRAGQHESDYRRRIPATFEGGPLAGMTVSVKGQDAARPLLRFGLTTDTGPCQVLYERAGTPGVWRFSRVEIDYR